MHHVMKYVSHARRVVQREDLIQIILAESKKGKNLVQIVTINRV